MQGRNRRNKMVVQQSRTHPPTSQATKRKIRKIVRFGRWGKSGLRCQHRKCIDGWPQPTNRKIIGSNQTQKGRIGPKIRTEKERPQRVLKNLERIQVQKSELPRHHRHNLGRYQRNLIKSGKTSKRGLVHGHQTANKQAEERANRPKNGAPELVGRQPQGQRQGLLRQQIPPIIREAQGRIRRQGNPRPHRRATASRRTTHAQHGAEADVQRSQETTADQVAGRPRRSHRPLPEQGRKIEQ